MASFLFLSLIDIIACFQCSIENATVKSYIVYFFLLGKFYCKPHFTHCKISNKHRKRRATLQVQGKVCMGYVTNARNTGGSFIWSRVQYMCSLVFKWNEVFLCKIKLNLRINGNENIYIYKNLKTITETEFSTFF